MPKDMRIAVIVAWLTKNCEEWKTYKRETLPKTYDSLYLANEKELEELQDVSVMNISWRKDRQRCLKHRWSSC